MITDVASNLCHHLRYLMDVVATCLPYTKCNQWNMKL